MVPRPQSRRDVVGRGLHPGEERVVEQALPVEEAPHPVDRVAGLPDLGLGCRPIPGRIVRRGVGAHPVRDASMNVGPLPSRAR